ncbi:MAG TPA: carboxypeptidase-like regulatory domain-containing protein [Hymenobacter sp.]|uniref:carboxypeptidase-like regulatory domain-containing protein n=1 Tax=Hymenobacter sp. TaxID=1898978 RepID=UPI002D7FA874|nr:carboxypeptidase-like regulatory domain-containing protein [Hymenobacter sp.]HET9506029.1 carboxypeptidase-like regulatory domain-containing protein [Hymenobacter sp.]
MPALLGLAAQVAQAQAQVSGRVLDAHTRQPVPYASVQVPGTTLGTTANAEGEFALRVPQLPAKVLAFSLGYGRDSATVAQPGAALVLRLVPAPIVLPTAEPPSYAAQLLLRAYRQMQRTLAQAQYGQAFYRQVTRNADEPTEVLEAVWDVKASSAGLMGSRLAQGRYGAKPAPMDFTNFSLYTKALGRFCGIAAPDTTDSHAVMSADPTKYFILHYRGLTQRGAHQLAEIAYESRPDIPLVQGSVYIDVASYQVLHARATRPLEIATSSTKASFREGSVTVEADFTPTATGALPNYVKVNGKLVMARKGKPDTPVRAESLTYFYDLRPAPTGLPYAGPAAGANDLAAIRQKTYDPAYWRDLAVVKRTPLEDEIMHSFEDKKAFGTLLNK